LWQGEDDVLPLLGLCELFKEKAEEGGDKVALHVLAGFQDALPPTK